MKKILLTFLVGVLSLPACVAYGVDFKYTYEGKTLTYTIISEVDKTVITKNGSYNYGIAGNSVSGNLILPEKVQYNGSEYTLIAIGIDAFCYCTGLTSVTIPNSVKGIERAAFSDCTGLTSVTIGSSVTSISVDAFYNCRGLTSITIPNSVTILDNSAFSGCTGLTSVTIPNSVTKIGAGAFSYCRGLTSVTIPNSVTSIFANVFRSCTGLTSVTIPNSVTKIGDLAFYGCSGLTSVEIPSSVTSIGLSAFSGCTGLTSVIIPSSVTFIDRSAFSGCTNLKEVAIGCGIKEIGQYGESVFGSSVENVYITASEPAKASDNTFYNYDANLWLTPGCANDYKNATNCWWQFKNIKELVVPTDFTTSRSEVTAETGKQVRVEAIFTPEDVTLPYVYWYSTNPKAATVDQNGLITIIDDSLGCDIVAVNLYETVNKAVIEVNGGQMGVEDITFDSDSESLDRPNDIYTMQGVLLKRNASQEDIDALAPGLYIIGGEKVLVK